MKRQASSRHLSARVALWHLGFRQTLKGAIIVGLLVGFMATVQGLAFGSTYPDEKSRTAFAATLESAPALGVLYGETKNLASATGYMVYRTVPVMALIASIWAIMTVTKLLRGQEEDGRWEVVTSAGTTPRRATALMLLGYASSMVVAFLIATIMITVAGSFPELEASLSTCLLITLAIFSPAVLFASLGVLTSQLAITRRRALMYVLVPLVFFFGLRSLANTVPDLYWLKDLTPFGWADMISPVFDPQAAWLLAFLGIAPLLVALGVYLVDKRDLGAGFIPEPTESKSRFYLLGSSLGLALRQNMAGFIGWGIATLAISLLIASIMGIAAEAVADSPSLGTFLGQLSGSTTDMKVAFLGAGLVFVVIALLIMAAVCVAGIRRDEAKNYLDNLLAQPIRRSGWLAGRLMQILFAFIVISVVCIFATWVVAGLQNISLDLWNMLLVSIALTGTIMFLLGFGTLLYGILPRTAVIGMYVVVAWSFIIDIVGSVVELNDIVIKSSLLHYVSVSVAEAPDWGRFAWLALFGLAMATVGIFAFAKRDIIIE
jgi:polyether ionophore transport system permease protein